MSRWITIDAERILYVHRGRDTILCTMHEFPLGATLVLRVKDDQLPETNRSELCAHGQ